MKKILLYALCLIFVSEVSHAGDALNLELEAIRVIESSDGTNTNHSLLTSGMHAGARAGGYYGIMPIVAKELIVKNPKTFARYAQIAEWDHDDVTEELNNNRNLDYKLARVMWSKLRRTMTSDQAACAWFWGPYAPRCKDSAYLETDAYVNKFRDALNKERIQLVRN